MVSIVLRIAALFVLILIMFGVTASFSLLALALSLWVAASIVDRLWPWTRNTVNRT